MSSTSKKKSQFPFRASATVSKRSVFVPCGAMCACIAKLSKKNRTISVADGSVDRPRLLFGFAFGVTGVRVDIWVGVAVGVVVGVVVDEGGKVGVMAAIGIAERVGARMGMKLIFIAQR